MQVLHDFSEWHLKLPYSCRPSCTFANVASVVTRFQPQRGSSYHNGVRHASALPVLKATYGRTHAPGTRCVTQVPSQQPSAAIPGANGAHHGAAEDVPERRHAGPAPLRAEQGRHASADAVPPGVLLKQQEAQHLSKQDDQQGVTLSPKVSLQPGRPCACAAGFLPRKETQACRRAHCPPRSTPCCTALQRKMSPCAVQGPVMRGAEPCNSVPCVPGNSLTCVWYAGAFPIGVCASDRNPESCQGWRAAPC